MKARAKSSAKIRVRDVYERGSKTATSRPLPPSARSAWSVAATNRAGGRAVFISGVEAIVEALAGELRAGDRVAILSNGGFGGIHDKLLEALGGVSS